MTPIHAAADESAQVLNPQSVEEVQELMRSGSAVAVCGGRTKPALQTRDGRFSRLETGALAGILEYDPGEYTFTALAGTALTTVQAALAEHAQYLPFDPPLADAGATLGGTVAAGLSGSGRQRYGGVRDFLVGVRYVDGTGRLVRGGGKVVKNAAGFDLPKLMVGSLGQLGILVEVSFKVFPQPESYATLELDLPTMADGAAALQRLAQVPLDLDAVDILAPARGPITLLVRMGGLPTTLPARMARLQTALNGGTIRMDVTEPLLWRDAGTFGWTAGEMLVKVALAPGRLVELDGRLAALGADRRYAALANLGWIGLSAGAADLGPILADLGLTGLVLRGGDAPILGTMAGTALFQRLKAAMDPHGQLPTLID